MDVFTCGHDRHRVNHEMDRVSIHTLTFVLQLSDVNLRPKRHCCAKLLRD